MTIMLIACAGVVHADADGPAMTESVFTAKEHGFAGLLLEPAEASDGVGIIVLGGSEGGIPRHKAHLFVEAGFNWGVWM